MEERTDIPKVIRSVGEPPVQYPEEEWEDEEDWDDEDDQEEELTREQIEAQDQLGDIVFIDIPTEGETLEAGEVFGTIEVVKTVSDLFLPIAGEVLCQNEALADNPELVNQDPYGEGWLIKIKPNNAADIEGLLDAEAYQAGLGE